MPRRKKPGPLASIKTCFEPDRAEAWRALPKCYDLQQIPEKITRVLLPCLLIVPEVGIEQGFRTLSFSEQRFEAVEKRRLIRMEKCASLRDRHELGAVDLPRCAVRLGLLGCGAGCGAASPGSELFENSMRRSGGVRAWPGAGKVSLT